MITATITRRIPITQLRPGAIVRGHTIDSIELAADGAAALAFPPGRTDGRRVRIPLGSLDGEVTIAAGPGHVQAVVQELGRVIIDGDGDAGGSDVDNAILTVALPSGWTFALHADTPAIDADDADDADGGTA